MNRFRRALSRALRAGVLCLIASSPAGLIAQEQATPEPAGQDAAAPVRSPDAVPAMGSDGDSDAAGRAASKPASKPANYRFEIDAPAHIAAKLRELSYLGRWQYRDDYAPSQFPGLLSKLQEESLAVLRSLGYYDGRIRISSGSNRVSLTIDAGARTTVAQSELTIDGPAQSDVQTMRFVDRRWLLPEGSFFESEAWERGKRGLVDALNQRGYLRARIVKSQARVDSALTAASLSVRIDSGARIAFGELRIEGLSRHQPNVVENLRPFRAGDPYSLDQMLAFQAALRGSGLFSGVSVVPDLQVLETDPQAGQVPLQVELVEYRAKRAVFGVGYSSEHGPRGQVGFEHRNLFGRSWQLESSLIAEARRQRLFANVRTPNDETGHFIGFGGRFERLDAAGELSEKTNVYIGRGKHSADTDYFLSVQQQTERRVLDALPGGSELVESAHALVLGYSWNLRRLDSRIDPTRGYTLSSQISGARKGLGSNRSFVRLYGRAMRFFPMPADSWLAGGSLIALGELGWVAASSRRAIPSENLFRAGGSQSVRGYGYQTLGVREAGATVGGRYLAVGSLEYQHPVSESIAAAVFYDLGNASDSTETYKAVAGYGIGMRWRTPVGPINLDLAYGEAVQRWRLHFSVGYTF